MSIQMQMEFADLNDEIGADDWLIPNEEISNRRLIKQTPRYNVYKADWFGDVLVYEPVSVQERKQQHLASRRQLNCRQRINQNELSCRLSHLDLSGNLKSPSSASVFSFGSAQCDSEQTDSAYSSISSTPQYHTKNIKSEFEFPTSKMGSPSLSSLTTSLEESNSQFVIEEDSLNSGIVEIENQKENKTTSGNLEQQSPVILNKESFNGSFRLSKTTHNDTCSTKSHWFELNELRLVAHESFMLFMGASMDYQPDDFSQQGTSLVMQMNHPKAVSLHYLLHNSNLGCISPTDRFLNYKQQRHQQLSNRAKLNICQQVINAMTYLHEKNIVHGKLTSVNIYIELNQRVKISLIDDDEMAIATLMIGGEHSYNNCVEFNLPSLTYLSPELIKTISVVNDKATSGYDNDSPIAHVQFDTNQLTKASDIFSFGTLLFELFEERFPFAKVQDSTINSSKLSLLDSPHLGSAQTQWNGNIKASASELIYQIGSGQIECKNLKNLGKIMKCPALVELIIGKCWSQDPFMRPHFKQLASLL